MATEVEFPSLTFLTRIAEIPVVGASLTGLQGLSSQYTQVLKGERVQGYLETAKGFSTLAATSALERSKPYHGRVATAIETADGYANKGLDFLKEKYPYPFEAQPEEVAQLLRERKEAATVLARKPLDPEFRADAKKQAFEKYVTLVEPKISPVLDLIESTVKARLPADKAPTSDAQYQYERALNLSKSVGGSILVLSTDQLKQLQEKNAYVKKAAESAESLSAITTTSLSAARERLSGVSEGLLAEFTRIKELSVTLSETLRERAKQGAEKLPAPVQEAYAEFIKVTEPLVADVREVAETEGAPWSDKLPEIGRRIKTHLLPQVEKLKERVPDLRERLPEFAARGRAAVEAFKASPSE